MVGWTIESCVWFLEYTSCYKYIMNINSNQTLPSMNDSSKYYSIQLFTE